MIIKFFSYLLPWSIRRRVLEKAFGYSIHPSARIGLSWIFPKQLIMEQGSKIDHFTVAINLERIFMGKNSKIGRGNWITGFPLNPHSKHFQHQINRRPQLILGESTAITKNHHIDCTDLIEVGSFTTLAGYNSQFLTHSIDVFEGRQDSAPIIIGKYCFVGTNSVVLGGSILPSYSVLGAKSLLNKPHSEEWKIYGGVPAKPIGEISKEAKYFNRRDGFVH